MIIDQKITSSNKSSSRGSKKQTAKKKKLTDFFYKKDKPETGCKKYKRSGLFLKKSFQIRFEMVFGYFISLANSFFWAA
jgi:hypothetical protein